MGSRPTSTNYNVVEPVQAEKRQPGTIRNRSGSLLAEEGGGGFGSGDSSIVSSGTFGRFKSMGSASNKQRSGSESTSIRSSQDIRKTNYSKRASSIPLSAQEGETEEDVQEAEPQQQKDVEHHQDQESDIHPIGQEEQQQQQQAVNGTSAPAVGGGIFGSLDKDVPKYDLQDPATKTNGITHNEKGEEQQQQQQKESNGGIIAAATGGVSAALAGAGALFVGKNENGTPAADKGQDVEHDPEVPDEDPEQFDDGKPVDHGDARALIDEEKQTSKQAGKFQPPSRKRGRRPDPVKPLTSVQRHYLLKALVSIQMQMEWSELEKLGALTQYGYPFTAHRPKLKRVKDKSLQLEGEFAKGEFAEAADDPYADIDEDEARRQEGLMEPLILRHMFHVHLHTFPGLDRAPEKYWQKRIQPFFDEMAARNFSSSIERSETSARHFYTLAMTRYLGGFFARGVGVRGEGELKGPGKGEAGTGTWRKSKEWGKGTVKRGLDKPARPDGKLLERIDNLFDGAEGEVWRRAHKETTRVKTDWRAFKEFNIERETGLEETMAFLDVGNLRNLPPQYRNAEEYARHHAAYIFHTLFVNSPNADSFYNILRGIHLLFPYWGAKQLLKVANAQTMISGILNLLLARPAGAKSLVQRIFVSVIGGQASTINKEYVQPLKKEIGDTELTAKLEDYVKRGNRPERKAIANRALRTGQDVLATILVFASGPQLSQSKKNEVLDLHDSFARSPYRGQLGAAYPDSTPIGKSGDKPKVGNWTNDRDEQKDAKKYAMLKLYLRELLHRRDREQACQMASGSLLPQIIKESLDTVFYGPIKSIAEHSDLSARLGDLQNFFDDIIKTRKNSQNTLPDWIALTARHENSLYFLFHECAAIISPFSQWLQGGSDYMALGTTDPNHPANRKAKNVEVNLEALLQDDTLTEEDVRGIVKEADQLAEYVKWQKVWYELEMRKNFLLGTGAAIPQSGLCADDVPNKSMRDRIEDVDGLLLELLQQERVQAEDGIVKTDVRGTEMQDFPWAWFDAVDPLHQHLQGTDPNAISYEPKTASAQIPSFKHTRKALDAFQFALLEKLPAWREGDAKGVPATPAVLRKPQSSSASRLDGDASSIQTTTKSPSIANQTQKSTTKSRFKIPFMSKN